MLSIASITTSGSGTSRRARRLGAVELGARLDRRVGIDQAQALGHHLDLGLAERALHRVELAVDVRDADPIVVDEDHAADAAAHERLGRERADAADAEHGHGRAREPRDAVVAEQAGGAVEAAVEHGRSV